MSKDKSLIDWFWIDWRFLVESIRKTFHCLNNQWGKETYVKNSFEYSVNPNVKPNEIVQAWGEFKKDPVDLNSLGTNRSEAIQIFDKTGWK